MPLSKVYFWELSNYFAKRQEFMSMSKQLFYSFFKKVWEASFTKNNIKVAWWVTRIWSYNPDKILTIRTWKPFNTLAKKLHMRFAVKTPLSYHAMGQLA